MLLKLNNDLLNESLFQSVSYIINHYFEALDKDINNNNVNGQGLSAYLIAISEFYELIEQKEKWLENSYLLIKKIEKQIYKCMDNYHLGLLGGLSDYAFAINIANKKMNSYQTLLKTLNRILTEMSENTLARLNNTLDNVKVHDFDLVNGLTGVGKYFLSSGEIAENSGVLKKISKYLIGLNKKTSYKGQYIPYWCVKKDNQLRPEDKLDYPDGSIDFGIAHGIIAPLLYLSETYSLGISVENHLETIEEMIEIYMAWKFKDTNKIFQWPSQIGIQQYINSIRDIDKRNYRESWCYGSIGISRGLSLVGKYMNNQKLQDFAYKNIIAISQLDTVEYLLESPILCHGYSGILEIMTQTYFEKESDFLKNKINEMISLLINCFDKKFRYGFINKGSVIQDGFLVTKESEFFDILNGATGIILSLYSTISKDTLWQKQIYLK